VDVPGPLRVARRGGEVLLAPRAAGPREGSPAVHGGPHSG
jgi:hypothetical protein